MIRVDGNGGDDTLTISNSLTFTPIYNAGAGNNSLVLNAGEYDYTQDASTTSSNLSLIANNNAIFTFVANQHLASLTLNGTSSALMAEGFGLTMVTGALSMSPTATFDMADDDLVVHSTAANKQAMLSTLSDLLRSGRAGGLWNGAGIDSSTAANNANHSTGIAAIINDRGDGTVLKQSLGGEALSNNDIVLKYTYNGDANIDGTINADDYALIDSGFATHSSGYYNGDFNYSGGAPNSDDYFLIDKAYSDQAAPLSAPQSPASVAVAPQPAAASPAIVTSATTTNATKVAVKEPEKKHRHHKRNVIDALEVEPRMILSRRRD